MKFNFEYFKFIHIKFRAKYSFLPLFSGSILKTMVAVITGSSKGIGRSIALMLAEEGYDLFLCARNINDLSLLQTEILARFPNLKVTIDTVDVSKVDQINAYAHKIKSLAPSIDVLVNNAGVFIPGSVSNEPEGTLELMINTNLYSAYHLTRAVLGVMKAQQKGHIFNMCSIASEIAYPNGGSYSISKFALLGFSKVLREELKNDHIKVTSILPGATWSDSWQGVDLPQSRLMQSDDIASVIQCALKLSDSAVMEDITLRPQLGNL